MLNLQLAVAGPCLPPVFTVGPICHSLQKSILHQSLCDLYQNAYQDQWSRRMYVTITLTQSPPCVLMARARPFGGEFKSHCFRVFRKPGHVLAKNDKNHATTPRTMQRYPHEQPFEWMAERSRRSTSHQPGCIFKAGSYVRLLKSCITQIPA